MFSIYSGMCLFCLQPFRISEMFCESFSFKKDIFVNDCENIGQNEQEVDYLNRLYSNWWIKYLILIRWTLQDVACSLFQLEWLLCHCLANIAFTVGILKQYITYIISAVLPLAWGLFLQECDSFEINAAIIFCWGQSIFLELHLCHRMDRAATD